MGEQSPVDLPTAITGRLIVLRPIATSDYPTFFAWRTDLQERHLWYSSQRIPTHDEFTAELDKMLRQSINLLALNKRDGQPAGFVQAYNLNLTEGWCFSLAYMTSRYRQHGHGAEAYIALLDYLFRSFPLRKVYADVYEFNMDSMKPLMGAGFVEEGRFGRHIWFNDQFWDVFRLAMYREKWLEEGA